VQKCLKCRPCRLQRHRLLLKQLRQLRFNFRPIQPKTLTKKAYQKAAPWSGFFTPEFQMSSNTPFTSFTPLPRFDPREVPVVGVDSDLPAIPAARLTPLALRQHFACPPVWEPEHRQEPRFLDRESAQAAVLIALVERAELSVLLTQRAAQMSTHSGQIAFPGGRVDEGDVDSVHTALREAHEEIGLDAQHVELLGCLPTYLTGSNFLVTPVVALVKPDFCLRTNPAEVADVFEVPLAFLMNPANHRRHAMQWGGGQRQWLSMPYRAHLDALDDERFIWGATAAMLRNLYRFLAAGGA
jgi:8-oxo-dGTP pyrophosphatase MutT (NUDIX family)